MRLLVLRSEIGQQSFSKMFSRAIKTVGKSMFPIFRFTDIGAGRFNVAVVGTGFFISSNGNFLTTAHIFDGAPPNSDHRYWGRLPEEVKNPATAVTEIARDDDNDIFVGRVVMKTPAFLKISNKRADVGRTVCIAGYPLAVLTPNADGGLELSQVRRYFQPSFVLDHWITSTQSPTGKMRKHDGLLIRDFGLYGMSGGPVFDTAGRIVGMQGSVTNPRESTNGKDTIKVQNALAIRSNLILDFIKDQRIKFD